MTRERLLLIAILIGAGLLARAVYVQRREIKRLSSALEQKDAEIRRLGDGTVIVKEVRGAPETVLIAAERAGFDVDALQADLSDHGAALRGLLEATKRSEGETRSGLAGNAVPGASTAQQLVIQETIDGKTVPWGAVVFDAAKERPWTLTQAPRAYTTSVVLAEEDDGGLTAYTRMRIEALGERLDLAPTIAVLRVTSLESRWRWTAMPMLTLDAGVRSGAFDWLPGAAVAFASFGPRREQPEWTFLGVGLAYGVESRNVALSIQPVSYSLRSVLPVMTTSVGPAAFFDVDGARTYAMGLRVAF